MLKFTTRVYLCLFLLLLQGCGGGSTRYEPEEEEESNQTPPATVVSEIRINPLNSFEFRQDTAPRADKVVGSFDFTLTDTTNDRFVRDLDNANMSFQERAFGSEAAFITEVEATLSSDIDIAPIDVVYLIDNSFSVVQAAAGDALAQQANSLADKVNQQNVAAGATANTVNYRLFADSVSELRSSTEEQPFNAIEYEARGGGTALYEGIQLSLMDLSSSEQPALFVFTDGRENASSSGYDLDLILTTSQQFNIPVYIVGLGDVDNAVLTQIADTSGGNFFRAQSVEQLSEVFDGILGSIPVRYSVTYNPTQRTGHIEFKFVVEYSGASDSVTADFNVDEILAD